MFVPARDGDDRVILDEEVARFIVSEMGLAECEHCARFYRIKNAII